MIIRIMGGLGNQMFQYAQARSLFDNGLTDIQFDIDCLSQKTSREYLLNKMNVVEFPIADKEKVSRYVDYRNLCLRHGFYRFFSPLIGYGFEKKDFQIQSNESHSYIDGYWQNESYFQHLRNELICELKYVWPMDDKQIQLADSIENCNSIAVHVRRGDYLSVDNSKYFNLLTKEKYYDEAIRMVHQKFDNVKLFFFSDDIEWCKKSFCEYDDAIFIDNNITSSELEDFEMMKKCKHFIISNSTFSWWASWLSNYEHKFTVAPSRWYVDDGRNKRCVNGLLNKYTLI